MVQGKATTSAAVENAYHCSCYKEEEVKEAEWRRVIVSSPALGTH